MNSKKLIYVINKGLLFTFSNKKHLSAISAQPRLKNKLVLDLAMSKWM